MSKAVWQSPRVEQNDIQAGDSPSRELEHGAC